MDAPVVKAKSAQRMGGGAELTKEEKNRDFLPTQVNYTPFPPSYLLCSALRVVLRVVCEWT